MIQDEKIRQNGILVEDRGTMSKSVIEQAKQGRLEVVTSTLCLAEVCKNRDIKDGDPSKIAAFFENDFVLLANLDRLVGERARELMMAGHSGLKPPDACHLATAAVVPNVAELHTFDDILLDLDLKVQKADKSFLRICKPRPDGEGEPPPLLKGML